MFFEYAVYLENLSLYSFTTLVEHAQRTNNSLVKQRKKSGKPNKQLPPVSLAWDEDYKDNKKPNNST